MAVGIPYNFHELEPFTPPMTLIKAVSNKEFSLN